MKGDFTRHTFRRERHFSGVRMQQGRVQLDADWNEQADIGRYRDETETTDVVGGCGGPLHDAAFAVTVDAANAGDFLLGAGRYYVDGLLCENEEDVRWTQQPDLPGLEPLDVTQVGFHIVYLDAWHRHVTVLDEPRLRETALGGPDTASRTRTVWQVRTVFGGAGLNCLSNPTPYVDATAPSTALLRARAEQETVTNDPCLVPSGAGFRGLENQLYRVEIHDPGEPYDLASGTGDTEITSFPAANQVVYASGTWQVGQAVEVYLSGAGSDPMAGFLAYVTARNTSQRRLTLNVALPPLSLDDQPRLRRVGATYKWSRDNGSVVALVRSITGPEVVVHTLGPDSVLDFRPGHWLELIDDERELRGLPGTLVQIEAVDPATRTITLRAAPAAFPGDVTDPDPARRLKARRWDGAGAAKINAPAPSTGYAELEDGVQVRFEAGAARTGDHWLVPARTATADAQSGTIEWPAEAGGDPAAQPPLGIEHHYCKLALLESDGTTLTATDCRNLFPPLTELATLVYVGGDGQETLPGEPQPQLLEVGVFRGRHPVANERVRFTADTGGALAADHASLPGGAATFEAVTGADGLARAAWQPANDTARPSQQVLAEWLDAGGTALAPHVAFNGTLSLAARVSYTPDPACTDLANADTVQEALDLLCARPVGGETCCVGVRPEQRLDEVIRGLIEAGRRDLCICLAPGEHTLPDGLLLEEGELALRIRGSGRVTRLVVESGPVAVMGARAFGLHAVDVTLAAEPLFTGFTGDVSIEDCRLRRREPSERALVQIESAERVQIAGNVLDARFSEVRLDIPELDRLVALDDRRARFTQARDLSQRLQEDNLRRALIQQVSVALDTNRVPTEPAARALVAFSNALRQPRQRVAVEAYPALLRAVAALAAAPGATGAALTLGDGGAETALVDNEILGVVTIYGEPVSDVVLTIDVLRAARALQQQGGLTIVASDATFHARGNRLTRLALGGDTAIQISRAPTGAAIRLANIFRGLHLTENTFADGMSQILAEHCVLTGDHFDNAGQDVGGLIADSAIYTANYAPNDVRLFDVSNRTALAANLMINIVQL